MSILIKPAYDTDASAYFTTAGVTSTAGRQQVSRFVTGIKNLGLWNNMVCWPLRSSQNAGTGTIAYSLGGLGTFNGTLTNGPTWGDRGITFDGTDDLIQLPTITVGNFVSILYCANHSTLSGGQKAVNIGGLEIGKSEGAGGTGIESVWLANPYPIVGRTTSISGFGASITYFASIIANKPNTTLSRFYNGSSKLSNLSADLSGNPSVAERGSLLGGRKTGANPEAFNGIMSVALYFSIDLSDSQNSSIYSLYKSTLGQGLGLP